MKEIYLWQNSRFPQFEWDTKVLLTPLGEVHTLQGQLLGRMAALGFEGVAAQVEALTSEILGSSQIEISDWRQQAWNAPTITQKEWSMP